MTSIPPGASIPPGRTAPSPVLRALPGVDWRKLPLTPLEGNVFSRVDGSTTEPQIVASSGLPAEAVHRAVTRLLELRVIEVFDPVKAAQHEELVAAGRHAFGGLGNLAGAPKAPPTPGLYDPRELEEKVELEPEKLRLIMEAYHRLDHLDYYELLGVHRLVDRKQVKSAYYALAPDFHPDKYFQRNLGKFRGRIETIFARLTLAHDVLSSKQKRVEYDEYLDMLERNRALVAATQQTQHTDVAVAQALADAERAARAAVESLPPLPGPSDEATAQALAERKRVLAMKLMGGAKRPVSIPAPAAAPGDARAAAEALRNRFEHARQDATRRQVAHYIAVGRDGLAQGDYAAAANAYRIATTLNPGDPNLQRDAADVIQQANRALSDSFLKQGEYEIGQNRFSEAAISFGKAANGRPDDPRGFDRAAFAIFRAGNNPRRAVEYARRAVELDPQHWQFRVTLAYAFVAAGLLASVEGELARILESAGGNEKAKAQVSQIRDYLKQAQTSGAGR